MRKPACMDWLEFDAWAEFNRRLYQPQARARTPCDDCLTDFALEMRSEGRCDGTPRGYQDDDDPSNATPGVLRSAEVRAASKALRIAEAVKLHEMGLSQRAIADRLKLAPSTVCHYIGRGT